LIADPRPAVCGAAQRFSEQKPVHRVAIESERHKEGFPMTADERAKTANEFAKVWFAFSRDYRTYMETALAPGLTEGQLIVLEFLLSRDNVKPSDLLDYLATTPAAVTTLLDRMERNGLIVRERNESDRRIVWVRPTAKGRAEAERGIVVRTAYLQSLLDRISAHNQKLLLFLLNKLLPPAATEVAADANAEAGRDNAPNPR